MHVPGPPLETKLKKLKKRVPLPSSSHQNSYILGYGTSLPSKKLIKLTFFDTLDKTLLGETESLSNL